MIQRIQSLFLFVAAVLMLLGAFFFEIWVAEINNCTYVIDSKYVIQRCTSLGEEKIEFIGYIFMLEMAFAAICFLSLINYKKRKRQILFGGINSLLGSACLASIVFLTRSWIKQADAPYALGFYLPLVAILLNILANKYIRKDEKMVKSLDSIR